MFRKSLSCLLGLATLGATATHARADGLVPDHVPANATWVMHVDMDEARETEAFRQLETEEEGNLAAWMHDRYGMKPDEISSLTLYGVDQQRDRSVALLYADFNEEKVRQIVARQPGYESTQHGEVTLHTWTTAEKTPAKETDHRADRKVNDDRKVTLTDDDRPAERAGQAIEKPAEGSYAGRERADRNHAAASSADRKARSNADRKRSMDHAPKRMTAAFIDEDIAVFGATQELVRKAVDEIQQGEGLAGNDFLENAKRPKGTVLYGVVFQFAGENPNAQSDDPWALLGDVERATIAIGEESARDAFVLIEAETESDEAARKTGEVMEGLQALAALSGNSLEGQDASQFVPQLEQDGSILRAQWTLDAEQLAKTLRNRLQAATQEAEQEVEQAQAAVDETVR